MGLSGVGRSRTGHVACLVSELKLYGRGIDLCVCDGPFQRMCGIHFVCRTESAAMQWARKGGAVCGWERMEGHSKAAAVLPDTGELGADAILLALTRAVTSCLGCSAWKAALPVLREPWEDL